MSIIPDQGLLVRVSLLWLAGVGLRLTILAIPPVTPLIRADLRLSGTEVGLLGSLPVAVFALAAIPGSLLVARLGTLPTLVGGLLIAAVGSGLRGASPNAAVLYLTTVVMGLGIAVMQPTLPAVVRRWLPGGIGFGTAIYTNGLLIGEVLAVMLTIPVVMPLVGGAWRLDLVVWSVPLVVTAALVAAFAPRSDRGNLVGPPLAHRWWPDWRSPLIWQLGLLFGSINSIYFVTNTFLPDYLTSAGRADLISVALTALNLAQIPTSLVLLVIAGRLERRAWPFILAGCVTLVSLAGLVSTAGLWTIVWASAIGIAGSATLILGLTLPPLLSAPRDVARTSAAMFTISYAGAVGVAIVSGAAWDLSGLPSLAFGPVALCAVAQIACAAILRLSRHIT